MTTPSIQNEIRPTALNGAAGTFGGDSFFVSVVSVYAQVTDQAQWVEVNASTINGAKRLAVRRASGATFSARVATKTAAGEFKVIAALHNSAAITGRRAFWK